MGFFIELIVEFLGDIAIDLTRMKKEKRKVILDDAKAYFREKLARWKKK